MLARGGQVVTEADRTVRKVALAVDATVVLATPVDTGRARANWQVELGGPASGEVGRAGERFSSTTPIAQGAAAIALYKGGPNASIHITNNLPYIGRLNDGHSAQAPAGFVEQAVLRGADAVRNAQLLKGPVR